MRFNHCRSCGTELKNEFSLGDLYISNFIPADANSEDYPKSDITLCSCYHCGLLQLSESVDPNILYKNYWYKSGINNSMDAALLDVVNPCLGSVPFNKDDIFLDIACNDGTLLKHVHDMKTVGVDPSNVAKVENGTLINDYFSADSYFKVMSKRAKIITCIAMFYDLDDPRNFLRDVYKVMHDDGIFVVQLSYTPLMLKQLAFDNMCAEHVCYYDIKSLEYVLNSAGFKVVDCTLNDVNGGSFRVFCMKEDADITKFRSSPQRDVANHRVESLRDYEANSSIDLNRFLIEISSLSLKVRNYIKEKSDHHAVIYAYGASTKGNTLLQYFGLDHRYIDAAVERNPDKVGLKTVGTEIPIISEEEMRANPPDYLLILPWHFINEFKRREYDYLKGGGKFIVPCPTFEIVEYDEKKPRFNGE